MGVDETESTIKNPPEEATPKLSSGSPEGSGGALGEVVVVLDPKGP